MSSLNSVMQNGTNALAGIEQLEGLVDSGKRHFVGDELVDLDLAIHVALDIAGQLAAALDAAESRAAPHPAGNELERPGRDFLAGTGHADNDRLAPALVAALQRLAHDVDVADALERVIDAAVGQVDDDLLDGVIVVFGVDEIGGSELTCQIELVGVDVDGDDALGAGHDRALDDCQADRAKAEDGHRRTGLDFRSVEHGTNAGGHATAEQADL